MIKKKLYLKRSYMNKLELCKGCKSYLNIYTNRSRLDSPIRRCLADPIKNDKQCPCIECLIKGMCSKGCEAYNIHSRGWWY